MNDQTRLLMFNILTSQRRLASLQDEAHVVEMDLQVYRQDLQATIDRGEVELSDEELMVTGLRPRVGESQ